MAADAVGAAAPARLLAARTPVLQPRSYRRHSAPASGTCIAVAADEDTGVARAVVDELEARGHELEMCMERLPTATARLGVGVEAAARDVAEGPRRAGSSAADGTGAWIAANKVPGVRAALRRCAYSTAPGAGTTPTSSRCRRTTSPALLGEILDVVLRGAVSTPATVRTSST